MAHEQHQELIQALHDCAAECEKHVDHHDHCKRFAEACRRCAEACRNAA